MHSFKLAEKNACNINKWKNISYRILLAGGFQGGWARVVDDAFERACLWKIITEGKIVVEICLRL